MFFLIVVMQGTQITATTCPDSGIGVVDPTTTTRMATKVMSFKTCVIQQCTIIACLIPQEQPLALQPFLLASAVCLQVLPQRLQLTSSLLNHTPKLALYSTCPAGGPGSNAYLLQEQDPDFNSCSKLVYDSSVAGSFWLMLEGFDLESSSAVS